MNDKPEEIKKVEQTEVIAVRVPPGDQWQLNDDDVIHQSLTDVLEAYFGKTQFKGDFRFSPREGKIFTIKTVEEKIPPKVAKKYNLYGDPI